VEDTINIGAETASTLKGQTDQLGWITNELDTIHISVKKSSQLVSWQQTNALFSFCFCMLPV
jgi:SNARE protein